MVFSFKIYLVKTVIKKLFFNRLVAFNTGHPQLAHKSIHLISHMASSSPSNHRQLTTALLTSSSDVTQGFVEILDQTCDSMTNSC